MREILFRGKCVDSNEWAEGWLMNEHIVPKGQEFTVECRNPQYFVDTDRLELYEIISSTIGQYTGLTDKNGNKIFEGDIVCFGGRNFVVWWNEECFQWQAKMDKGDYVFPVYEGGFCEYEWNNTTLGWIAAEIPILGKMSTEIIGNIFDNPELLEVAEYTKENLLSQSKTKAECWFKYKSMICCPKCASGFDVAMRSDYNYCPNCGVKLSEE